MALHPFCCWVERGKEKPGAWLTFPQREDLPNEITESRNLISYAVNLKFHLEQNFPQSFLVLGRKKKGESGEKKGKGGVLKNTNVPRNSVVGYGKCFISSPSLDFKHISILNVLTSPAGFS